MNQLNSFLWRSHDLNPQKYALVKLSADSWIMVQWSKMTDLRIQRRKLRATRPVGYAAGKNDNKTKSQHFPRHPCISHVILLET